MAKIKEYDKYDLDHPVNVSKRCIKFIQNRLDDGRMDPEFALNYCSHGYMVGKPRSAAERKNGRGCECPLEEYMER